MLFGAISFPEFLPWIRFLLGRFLQIFHFREATIDQSVFFSHLRLSFKISEFLTKKCCTISKNDHAVLHFIFKFHIELFSHLFRTFFEEIRKLNCVIDFIEILQHQKPVKNRTQNEKRTYRLGRSY